MKKHCSVLLFYANKKIWKVSLILLLMFLVSITGFRFLEFMDEPYFCSGKSSWFLGLICFLGYAGCVFVCTELPSSKSRTAYTYQRLMISERETLLWDMLTSVLVFLSFYAVEILLLFAAARMYSAAPDYLQGEQGIVAAFYRTPFLHAMVPMAEKGLWIRNIVYCFLIGMECACSSLKLRYHRTYLSFSFLLAFAAALRFPARLGSRNYFFPSVLAIAAVISIIRTFRLAHNGKWREENEDI